MKHFKSIYVFKLISVVLLSNFVHLIAYAGLLEIPDVRDSTTLKGKSVYENIDIPEVRERDPDPEAGIRVWVLEVKVQGVVERPEYGITKKGIDEYIEKIRSDAMKEEELLKYGYSLKDLSEIADLMIDIDAGKELEKVTEPDVQQLIWLVRQLKDRRGLTLVNIEQLAEKLTNYYRERGFFLTKVYVPKQEVRKGVVVLTVLEGKLGKVTVSDNESYESEFIASAFDNLLFQPVTEKEIEQKLYLLNDYPGLDVYGYFKAGDQVGDTWLKLQVRGEDHWSATARIDNHGSDLTGDKRVYAEVNWHNPLKIADNLTLGMLKTASPDNSTYGVIRYRLPVYSEEIHFGFNVSRNQFVTTVRNINIDFTGDTTISEFTGEYAFVRRREMNWSAILSLAKKDSDLVSSSLDFSDSVNAYSIETSYDYLDEQSKVLHQANISFTSGEITESELETIQDGETFTKFNTDYSFLSFLNIPWININSRLIFKTNIQYSNSTLPSVEQFSIAGANAVRAFEVATFSGDGGIYMGLDWILSTPKFLDFNITEKLTFSRLAQPFLFMDYGYAKLNSFDTGESNTGTLSGYGMGLQFNYKNKISGNLQLAKPYDSEFTQEAIRDPGDDLRLIMDVQYLFN